MISLMSEFNSKVATNGSPARRGYVHPPIAWILCSQWWSSQREVPLVPHSTLGTQCFVCRVIVYKQSSHLEKVKEHFAQRKRKKTHECHLLSFVFSWLMLEFLFLTCTCKPILPRYELFWFFTMITSCSSCLDC